MKGPDVGSKLKHAQCQYCGLLKGQTNLSQFGINVVTKDNDTLPVMLPEESQSEGSPTISPYVPINPDPVKYEDPMMPL
jgi:hypothetical protein